MFGVFPNSCVRVYHMASQLSDDLHVSITFLFRGCLLGSVLAEADLCQEGICWEKC